VGTDEQNMMVLDAIEVTLQPQETVVLSPYVICIQAEAAVPSSGASYQLGYLESDVLLDFAQCVDEEADGTLSQDDLSLQIAVWTITSGGNELEMPELTGIDDGALTELMEELEAFTDMMEELEGVSTEIGDEWLQRCDISVDDVE
jgi:hypothetical protein